MPGQVLLKVSGVNPRLLHPLDILPEPLDLLRVNLRFARTNSYSARGWPRYITMSMREEFRCSKLSFQDTYRERFLTFHWRLPGVVYVLYRLALAAYTLTILIRDIKRNVNKQVPEGKDIHILPFWAFLTEWTYILLTVYFCYHALVTLAVYNSCQGLKLKFLRNMDFTEHKYLFRELYVMPSGYQHANNADDDPMDIVDRSNHNSGLDEIETNPRSADDDPMDIVQPSDTIPWYLCLVWILFNTASVFALVVTLVFWTLLAQEMHASDLWSEDNLQIHLMNSVLVLLELSLTAIPVRLLHGVYPLIYGLTYVIFAVVYWSVDHRNVVYDFLDFGKSPGAVVASILVIGFILVPLLQLILYGLYRLKLYTFRQFCWN
ncbi:protein rolling stone-like [Elysia marginata]|uniref:Protein rolling stone-like n=1 Tax=Elysia marginata TaxID=1093978 RepID=A0AAV4HDI7_9GAST|nr:protein rolling stone-like [Elysia marginata]